MKVYVYRFITISMLGKLLVGDGLMQVHIVKEISDFWHSITPVQARQWCEQAAKSGEIVPVTIAARNGEKPRASFALGDWQARLRKLPDAPDRMRLLSPFDPVIRDRARVARLFGFDYRFE